MKNCTFGYVYEINVLVATAKRENREAHRIMARGLDIFDVEQIAKINPYLFQFIVNFQVP